MLSLIVSAGSSGFHASEPSAAFVGMRLTPRRRSNTSFSSSMALLERRRPEHKKLKKAGHIIQNVFWRMVAEGRGGVKKPGAIKTVRKGVEVRPEGGRVSGRIRTICAGRLSTTSCERASRIESP